MAVPLAERSGRSYDVLANRAGISRSMLHRYRSSAAVPTESGSPSTSPRSAAPSGTS
ncbi:hypothetical protein [Allokutzneria sp. NRRL B-24872]|uniref:hypothetical protein n=1 Tax=Allokutzneria sp. NRRL B-24872 TaxID=1137961 RepID=UPI00143D320B|nr:hypothetical protein [Allokutzneria sp. NRRL B-24872]